jgi:hypothetical protein
MSCIFLSLVVCALTFVVFECLQCLLFLCLKCLLCFCFSMSFVFVSSMSLFAIGCVLGVFSGLCQGMCVEGRRRDGTKEELPKT